MAKRGRPKLDDPRDIVVSIRMNDEEYQTLERLSEIKHMSICDTVRQILDSVKYAFPELKKGE